ncbi:MAG: alpha/beta hydrolase [Balneolaceae bacterium]|nr:MAG: alpha/beta hydrolase [Balneolaceae bacterium]
MKSIMSFLLTIAAGYLVILLLMYLFQNRLLFMPTSGFIQTPESVGVTAVDVWVETEDGVKLHAWYFPHEESGRVIVLSHGNAGNISYRIDIARTLLDAGAAVLMYDYRGYGKSEGRPSEKGLYKDITAFTEHLKGEKGYPEQNIYMYGRSLGAAVAAYAATKYDLGGLVLDSAFKNLRAMVSDVYPFVPSSLARYEFPTETYLRQLEGMPVMIMHSPDDEIVGYHNGQYLYEVANEPKQFIELRGGHNDNFFASRDLIERSWREFLNDMSNNPDAAN